MSWLHNINERATLVTIGGDTGGPAYNYRVTPCLDKQGEPKGSYACFLDLATLPDYKSGAQIEAIAALIQEIKEIGMVPVIAPDHRPLPSPNGARRVVGGVMVYANPALQIKPKSEVRDD
tara:strand:- start:256 stop:615 length:360 start_codon:yes stop_codon:yes gene_type:complete